MLVDQSASVASARLRAERSAQETRVMSLSFFSSLSPGGLAQASSCVVTVTIITATVARWSFYQILHLCCSVILRRKLVGHADVVWAEFLFRKQRGMSGEKVGIGLAY